ncbi:MAG: ribulose-phosphate 3-epimerase [Candidatus Aadella gelida]|nr:ribulose-phosphate 3-epimerase [Candidatus Aadella gelida]
MDKKIIIAPSILSADFGRLAEEIKAVELAGADWVHVDVMDGIFVPNITIGPGVIKSVKKVSDMFFDVHLMIDRPERYIDEFASAGSDMITFHIEACASPEDVIKKIRQAEKKVGISVKPGTEISLVEKLLDKVDMVLVMTVEPGFGGQSFMRGMLDKVRYLKENFDGYIQVDGGVNKDTAREIIKAGGNVLVAGTAIFGQKDYSGAIKEIRG